MTVVLDTTYAITLSFRRPSANSPYRYGPDGINFMFHFLEPKLQFARPLFRLDAARDLRSVNYLTKRLDFTHRRVRRSTRHQYRVHTYYRVGRYTLARTDTLTTNVSLTSNLRLLHVPGGTGRVRAGALARSATVAILRNRTGRETSRAL